MLGAIIGALGSIAGGLIGGSSSGKSREKTKSKTKSTSTTRTRSHLGQMVKAAERNGFNPLTVLRSGGLSAYATSQNTGYSISRGVSRGRNSQSTSAPLGSAIAGAAQSIGAAVGDIGSSTAQGASDAWAGLRTVTTDPVVAKAQEYDLVQQQLKSGPGPGTTTEDGGNPYLPGSSTWWQNTPPLGYDAKKVSGLLPTFEAPTVTNPVHPETGFRANPWAMDAEMAETRYGDILSNVAGVYNVGADLYWNRELIANKLVESAYTPEDRKIVEGVMKEVNPYVDSLKDTWDAIPPVVNSVTQAAVKKIQGEPPMSYIGRVDRAGLPRESW